jgi:hypothetical protein
METITSQQTLPTPAQDRFKVLESLKISSDLERRVERILSRIPVGRPSKESFFRIHPDYALDALVLEVREEGEVLLVDPALYGALADEKCVSKRILRLGITRQRNLFVYPVRPPQEGRRDDWAITAIDAVNRAEREWIRMQADMNRGGYKLSRALVTDEPVWPDLEFGELLRIAFNNAVVDTLDHPTLKRLRGEV